MILHEGLSSMHRRNDSGAMCRSKFGSNNRPSEANRPLLRPIEKSSEIEPGILSAVARKGACRMGEQSTMAPGCDHRRGAFTADSFKQEAKFKTVMSVFLLLPETSVPSDSLSFQIAQGALINDRPNCVMTIGIGLSNRGVQQFGFQKHKTHGF